MCLLTDAIRGRARGGGSEPVVVVDGDGKYYTSPLWRDT